MFLARLASNNHKTAIRVQKTIMPASICISPVRLREIVRNRFDHSNQIRDFYFRLAMRWGTSIGAAPESTLHLHAGHIQELRSTSAGSMTKCNFCLMAASTDQTDVYTRGLSVSTSSSLNNRHLIPLVATQACHQSRMTCRLYCGTHPVPFVESILLFT